VSFARSLFNNKDEIENKFGDNLTWERLDDKRASRIKYETNGNVFEKEQWENMSNFMIDAMIKFENIFKNYMLEVNKQLKNTVTTHPI
jgi:hypothetical protein